MFFIKIKSLLLTLMTCFDQFVANNICGDWDAYKDEKCFKIIHKTGLQTYDQAEKYCTDLNSSTLATIHSKEEQEFISSLLFETNSKVDNVWIGAKKIGYEREIEWSDGSELIYTNWVEGSPINSTDNNCVEMMGEKSLEGKWADVSCTKKNLVMCQKNQILSCSQCERMYKQYISMRRFVNDFVLSDKFWGFKIFFDSNNRTKAFIYPKKENEVLRTWGEANDICTQYSGTLVSIDTLSKQWLIQSFLYEFGVSNSNNKAIWTSGKLGSDSKWRWMSTGNEISSNKAGFWWYGYPIKAYGDFVYVNMQFENNFGRWANTVYSSKFNFICEAFINI